MDNTTRELDPHTSSSLNSITMSSDTALFHLFLAFELMSLGGLLIMLITVTVSRIVTRRHVVWINFVVTLIISCISYSLLVGHPVTWNPSHAFCLTQAVLIYTVPTLTASATLALVIHVLITVRNCLFSTPAVTNPISRFWTFILVLLPYLLGGGMFVVSLVIGLKDPSTVRRVPGGFYCNMGKELPGKLSAILVAAIMIICLVFGMITFRHLRQNWSVYRGFSDMAHSKTTVIRVLTFIAFSGLAIALALVFFFTPKGHGAPLNIVLSLPPFAAVLVFGTQKDLINSWRMGAWAIFEPIWNFITGGARPSGRCSNTSSDRIPISIMDISS